MTPTTAQRISILPHVRYEIEILFGMPAVKGNTHVENAMLESLLVHARVLKEFFDSKSRYKDNVIPSDFGFTSEDTGISQDVVGRMHKDLAHLSYSRLDRTPDTKRWVFKNFIPKLKTRCVDFAYYLLNECDLDIPAEEKQKWIDLLKFLNTSS